MTCYFRHLDKVFKNAGIEVTPLNKKRLDKVIHDLVKITYKDCPSTWREVKKRIATNEDEFVLKLKSAWESQQAGEV